MKRLLSLIILPLLLIACTAELEEKYNNLESRVSKLETLCNQMNTNILSLQTLVSALQNKDYVTAVTPVKDGKDIIGYTLAFSKSTPVTIYHGENGEDGTTPQVGIKKHTDGQYYWTLDGEWLLDSSGNKIKANGEDGEDAVTPQMKVQDDYWYISYDNGKTWSRLEKATGDSFFKSVIEDDDKVTLTLADGTVINIPKAKKVNIEFDDSVDVGILPGGQKTIKYTLTNVTSQSTVKALGQNGWRAKATRTTNTTGTITVYAPDPLTDDEIIVLAYDGENSTIMKTINFVKGEVRVSKTNINVEGKGGSYTMTVQSNLKLKVKIPSAATGWITYKADPATKAMTTTTLTFSVTKNASGKERAAMVTVSDESGTISKNVSFYQPEYDQYTDITGGGETANCYIINAAGDYKFPIIKGNGQKGVIRSGETATITGAVSASVVWQDATIVESVGIKNGYVIFSTKSSIPNGNALLAVKDNTGKILWSWHIWSTSYKLGSGDIRVYNYPGTRSYMMMPLNLGSISTTTTSSTQRIKDSGVYYQWGRKDPFSAQQSFAKGTNGTLDLSIANPNTYYTWNNGGDWCSERRYDWWDKGSSTYNIANSSASDASIICGGKTIYDPCPPGYRVPPDDAFTIFSKTGANATGTSAANASGPFNFYYNFYANKNKSATINFKACGGFNASEGTYLSGIGYYQCAHAGQTGIGRQLVFSYDEVSPMCAKYSRALAGTIRPVRDDYVAPYESSDYSMDKTTKTLNTHSVGNGIKVIIAGDGFTDKDIASGKYDSSMQKAYEYLFTVEPFKSFRNRFDVVNVRAVSKTDQFNSSLNTAFETKFGNGTAISGNLGKAYNCAYQVYGTINNVLIIIVINDTRYAGTCWMSSNGAAVAFVPMSTSSFSSFENVIHHEAAGHGFSKLGDEYFYSGTIPTSEIEDLYDWKSYGWYKNIDVTNDPTKICWSQFLSDDTYKKYVGIYQGAYTYQYGAYRPTDQSIMRSNKGEFNAPSRKSIYDHIMKLSGESYSWESFVEYDKKNLSVSGYAVQEPIPSGFKPLPPPEIVDAEKIFNEYLQSKK